MEPNEDSIKILEMRIRHQMNRSQEKKIMPENIHHYLSSSAARRSEEPRQDIDSDEQGELRQMIPVDEKGNFGQEYEDLPFDASEYIDKVGKMSQRVKHIEISETKEVQLAKARNGYESARRSMDAEASSGIGKSHFFDAKG